MTLSLVFRIQALVFTIFRCTYATCMPASMMESFGGPGQSSVTMAGVLAKYVGYGFGYGLSKLADA